MVTSWSTHVSNVVGIVLIMIPSVYSTYCGDRRIPVLVIVLFIVSTVFRWILQIHWRYSREVRLGNVTCEHRNSRLFLILIC